MEKLLKSKNLRATPFRLEVLTIFGKYENAIEMSTIESELGSFDRITLFRTIKSFIQAGVVHEIIVNGDSKKFALCAEGCENLHHQHDHIHFHCTVCQETFCLDTVEMPSLNHPTFTISSFDIQAQGICESCN